MKSDRNIVFLGMMGSGKTSIGFLVSKKLKLDFYDVDHYIENKLKMKISNIFKNKGEKFFREYEEKITLELMKIKGIVVSLGGGAFLNKNIRNEVLKNHISFWLKTKDDILIQRIRKSAKRPLAYNVSNSDLQNMIKNRNKYYAKAQNKIDCHNKTKKEIVDRILDIICLEKGLSKNTKFAYTKDIISIFEWFENKNINSFSDCITTGIMLFFYSFFAT